MLMLGQCMYHIYTVNYVLPWGVLTFNVAMKIGALAEKRSVEWIVIYNLWSCYRKSQKCKSDR